MKRRKSSKPKFVRRGRIELITPPERRSSLYKGKNFLARVEAVDNGSATLLIWDKESGKWIEYPSFEQAEAAAKTFLKRDGKCEAVWKYHTKDGKEMARQWGA
ncbi:MAG: hypothetical protein PHC68_00645 [Syntrophorhabdaceae bacterium]|nr:hypothetical protein [Syntrophorhabdaceae bacterium]